MGEKAINSQEARIFFTYVWGAPGEPAWPLTFANKAARSHARSVLSEGDQVFTVCTKATPTLPELQGRVVGLYAVSDLEVNTADYRLASKHDDPSYDSSGRFPFALHPISVKKIVEPENIFSQIVGPLTPAHHLQAQSRLVELDAEHAASLLALACIEVQPAMPKTALGLGRVAITNSRLAPKHEGAYVASFKDYEIWYVYTLVLRDQRQRALAVKVGYAHDPKARRDAYNLSIASEITGLVWSVDLQQPTASEDTARSVEQSILRKFELKKLSSNGEILKDVEPMEIASAIAVELRLLRS